MPYDPLDPVERFFAEEVGVLTLGAFLAGGADFAGAGLTDEDVESYARIAAFRWHGAMTPGMVEALEESALEVLGPLAIDADPGPTFHPDGRVTVATAGNPAYELTPARVRHWLWLATLVGRRDLAEEYLAAVPPIVRAVAMERSQAWVDALFADLAGSAT